MLFCEYKFGPTISKKASYSLVTQPQQLSFCQAMNWLICFLGLAAVAAVSARSNGGQLLPTTNMRIINGEDARPNQFPHQVSLRVGNSHFCGGSIISSEWIVSAAHCVLIGQPFEVVAGTNSLSSGGSRHQVVEGYYDSNWDSNIIVYDYAVVRVSPPFTFSDAVQPISLGSGDPSGMECYASGWGRISQDPNNNQLPQNLQFTQLDALSDSQCRSAFGQNYPYYTDEAQTCTMTSGTNTCNGDSGGPLSCMNSGTPELYGITSFGFSSGGQDCVWTLPTGWADAASNYGREWINFACNDCLGI